MVIVLFCVNIDNTSSKLFTYLKNNEQRKDTVLANQSNFELFIYLFHLHHTHNNGIHLHKLYKQ